MDEASTVLKLKLGQREKFKFICGPYSLELGQATKIMGILNVTPDSFSNDGIYNHLEQAVDAAVKMQAEGADIIDIGGESTRPKAVAISAEEEKQRVLPIIKALNRRRKAPIISVDTTKSTVAACALAEGASIVNDISGLDFDHRMAEVVSRFKAGCVLMHIQGTPQTMQAHPFYTALIEEIIKSLKMSIGKAITSGIDSRSLIVDPGIGFGKTTEHNLQIIKNLQELASLNLPILIGTSRKSFIGNVLNLAVEERLWGTAATVASSILNGAHIVRVHDVKPMAQVAKMVDAILNC